MKWIGSVWDGARTGRARVLTIGSSLLVGLGIVSIVSMLVLRSYGIVMAAPGARIPFGQGAQPTATPVYVPNYPSGSQRVFAQSACTPIYSQASASSLELTQLMGGSDVTAIGSAQGWTHVHFWGALDGYIPSADLNAKYPADPQQGDCQFQTVPSPDPSVLPASNGPFAVQTRGVTLRPTTVYTQPDSASIPQAGLGANVAITITAWASDHNGSPWYQTQTPAGSGWVWSDDVRIAGPAPAKTMVNGKPIWSPVAGKGMWFTNYLTRHSDMASVLKAAKQAGLTHLYVEVAISEWGFYAPVSLDRILPIAHALGIPVIAWVYPYLHNVAADARMTAQVANYHTPSGDKADGVVTDVEEVVDPTSVYTYGQLLRALLGPNELLVDSALYPGASPNYPYAAVAASWNVIAPMDYWHSHYSRTYGPAEVRAFVTNSITTIRSDIKAGGQQLIPIEETGQTYDMFENDFTDGGHSPSAAEITADMQTAHDLGCIAVSFFEWQTATQDEWSALGAFNWK
ncbi:MAG TPA: hypothetical protein VMV29_23295 [Ktedonobacterales bacterium]|nr:hypothetical protein [Ktedonobacterales bacterium]